MMDMSPSLCIFLEMPGNYKLCLYAVLLFMKLFVLTRPDYKKLNLLRKRFPTVKTIALTATATPRVRVDILNQLGMKNPKW
jgi:hypothetical protein